MILEFVHYPRSRAEIHDRAGTMRSTLQPCPIAG